MNITTELSSQDADLFIKHLDKIAWRFTAACDNAEAMIAESIGADSVPANVNQVGETLMWTLNQARCQTNSQFARLRAACADAIAAGDTW